MILTTHISSKSYCAQRFWQKHERTPTVFILSGVDVTEDGAIPSELSGSVSVAASVYLVHELRDKEALFVNMETVAKKRCTPPHLESDSRGTSHTSSTLLQATGFAGRATELRTSTSAVVLLTQDATPRDVRLTGQRLLQRAGYSVNQGISEPHAGVRKIAITPSRPDLELPSGQGANLRYQ